MTTMREIYMFPPGMGGLNLKESPLGLGPEWLIRAQNIEYPIAGARSKRKGQQKINSTGLVEASPSTTVDQDSASGQKVLYVAATTGFGAGDFVAIGQGTAREEYGRVASVQAGVSLTLEDNLSSTQIVEEVAESQESRSSSGGLRNTSGQTFKKQGFVHGTSGPYSVAKVEVRLAKAGSPSGDVWVEIWGNNGSNEPDSSNKLSDESNAVKVSAASVSPSWGWISFSFVTPPNLTQGTIYHYILAGDFTINGTDYLHVGLVTPENYRGGVSPYCDGASADGSTWVINTNHDETFRIYKGTEVLKSAAVTGYLDFIKDNEQQIELVGASNGKLYTESGGTLTERASGLTTGTDVLWKMIVFKDNAILANGEERPRYTADGVTYTEISDASLPQKAQMPTAWRNRLWMAYGSSLYYSSLDSFTDWTTTGGEIPIRGGTGPITALIPFYKFLVVAKADFIAVITGSSPSDFAIQSLVEGVGIAGPAAWAHVGNNAVFVSLEDVRSLATVEDAGELKHNALSSQIEPFMRDEVNSNRRRYMQCAFYSAKQQFLMAHADRNSIIEDRLAVLDMTTGGWSTFSTIYAHVLATKRTSLGHRQLIAGGHDGFLRLLDTGDDDDGAGIPAIFQTPHLDLGKPNMVKGWRKLILFAGGRGASVLVNYDIDFAPAGSFTVSIEGAGDPLGSGAGSFQLGSSRLGGVQTIKHIEELLTGSGHFISFTFTNTNANQPFDLLGFGLEAIDEGSDKWV